MNHWTALLDGQKPYEDWAVFEFEPEKFRCGHDKTEANSYCYTSNGYNQRQCLTCKRESGKKYRGAA